MLYYCCQILLLIGFIFFNQTVYGDLIDIHGYISQGFLYSNKYNYLADTDGGTFKFNEMGINLVKGSVDSSFIGVQVSARDLGDIGNNKPYVDWALADWRIIDTLGIRFGKLKVPMGFYNETRDIDMLRTSVLLPSGVYIELLRDAWNGLKGFGIYGDLAHPLLGSCDYKFSIGTVEIEDNSGTAKMFNAAFENPISNIRNFEVEETFVGSFQWSIPYSQIKIGSTFMSTDWTNTADYNLTLPAIDPIPALLPGQHPIYPYGHPGFEGCDAVQIDKKIPIRVQNVQSYTLSASAQLWKIILSAEYFHIRLGYSAETPVFKYANNTATSIVTHGGNITSDNEVEGYYISTNYRLTEKIGIGAYYSWITSNVDDKDGSKAAKQPGNHNYSQWLRDYCLSILFDISEQWTLKFEGHLMDGHTFLYMRDNPAPDNLVIPKGINPSEYVPYEVIFPDRYWHMLVAKVTFSF